MKPPPVADTFAAVCAAIGFVAAVVLFGLALRLAAEVALIALAVAWHPPV